jgi:hypothetical protein
MVPYIHIELRIGYNQLLALLDGSGEQCPEHVFDRALLRIWHIAKSGARWTYDIDREGRWTRLVSGRCWLNKGWDERRRQ